MKELHCLHQRFSIFNSRFVYMGGEVQNFPTLDLTDGKPEKKEDKEEKGRVLSSKTPEERKMEKERALARKEKEETEQKKDEDDAFAELTASIDAGDEKPGGKNKPLAKIRSTSERQKDGKLAKRE